MDIEADDDAPDGGLWNRLNHSYDHFLDRILPALSHRCGRLSLIRAALFVSLGLSVVAFCLWNFDQGEILEVIIAQSPEHNYSKEAYVTLLSPTKPHPWTR